MQFAVRGSQETTARPTLVSLLQTMVAVRGDEVISVPIRDAVSSPKYVDPHGQLVQTAQSLGISFGDGR